MGKTIVRVDALDSDIGENGDVHYMLVNDEETPFLVDSNNGDVSDLHISKRYRYSLFLIVERLIASLPYYFSRMVSVGHR